MRAGARLHSGFAWQTDQVTSFLDSSQEWPSHSRPLAREALRQARKAGWLFRPNEGHTFGTLKCSNTDGACRLAIYSTSGPADGSMTAKSIKQVLRRCSHQRHDEIDAHTPEPQSTVTEIEWKVRRLLNAIEGLDQRTRGETAALAAVERDDEPALEESELALRDGDNQALVAFQLMGKPMTPWPPEIGRGELLDEADRLLSQESDQLEPLRRAVSERRT